jgi:hypothetical protein
MVREIVLQSGLFSKFDADFTRRLILENKFFPRVEKAFINHLARERKLFGDFERAVQDKLPANQIPFLILTIKECNSMSGMFPNNQTIEIFGEEVQWTGVDGNDKFTNGSFTDPMVKPSFIPAQTINLILENLEKLIEKCNGAPDSTTILQLAGLIAPLIQAHKIIQRDAQGWAKVVPPQAVDDIARLKEILDAAKQITPNGFGLYQSGRNLMSVLGVSTISDAMAALRARCNGTGTPDFSGLQIGDYLDGIDLSAIPAENGGTAGQAWNNTYKNNRVTLSAFNPYKGVGDTEVTKNHIRFDFANVPLAEADEPYE